MSQIVPKPVEISNRAFRRSRRRRRRTRGRGRKWLNALIRFGPLVAIVLLALAGLCLIPALAARRQMETGRSALQSAQSQLLHGSVDVAHTDFAKAQVAFGQAVNVTLGLPIIRTSVDHGTAFDIAGKGVADSESMVAAVLLAARLAQFTM